MSSSTPEWGDARSAWEREYAEVRAYTTSYRDELDRGVEFLLGFAAAGGGVSGPVLECACGRGRNAIPLARAGYRVIGLDHAAEALSQFRARARAEAVADRIVSMRHDLREALPLADESVGTVLDITAIDNLVQPEARRSYGAEIARVLRPGGLLAVVTFDLDDGYYRRFLDASPWPMTGVVEDPNTVIRNQLFRGRDLDAVFGTGLRLEAASRFDFVDEAAQERWTRRFHMRLYRKP